MSAADATVFVVDDDARLLSRRSRTRALPPRWNQMECQGLMQTKVDGIEKLLITMQSIKKDGVALAHTDNNSGALAPPLFVHGWGCDHCRGYHVRES